MKKKQQQRRIRKGVNDNIEVDDDVNAIIIDKSDFISTPSMMMMMMMTTATTTVADIK